MPAALQVRDRLSALGTLLDLVDFGANVHRALEAAHRRVLTSPPPVKEELPAIVNQPSAAVSSPPPFVLRQLMPAC